MNEFMNNSKEVIVQRTISMLLSIKKQQKNCLTICESRLDFEKFLLPAHLDQIRDFFIDPYLNCV